MRSLPFQNAHQGWFFLWQQVSITLVVQFELPGPAAWIAFRLLKINREIEKAAQHLELSIHRSGSPRPSILSRCLDSFMLELLDRERCDFAQRFALEILLQILSVALVTLPR